MNEQLCSELLAVDLGDISGLTFHAAGASETAEKPYGVVRFSDFAEHPVLLGNFDGTATVDLRTLPEETTQAEVDTWAHEILGRLAGTDTMDIALAGEYSAAQCWDPRTSSSSISDGVRVTTISATVSLVSLT